MSDPANEHLHLIKYGASNQINDYRPFTYGHLSSYDPALHRVKSLVPSLRHDEGTPGLTPWKPLETLWVGNGWGMQFAPVCGATFEKPTAGEQTKISIIERTQGVATSSGMTFNEVMKPPFPKLKAGEGGIKHKSGTLLFFHDDGSIEVTQKAGSTVIINKDGSILVKATGDSKVLTIDAADHIDVKTAELRCTGKVFAGYGTADQVGLQTHKHPQKPDSHGDIEQDTDPATPGT